MFYIPGESGHHRHYDLTDTSSTVTNEGDSTFESSPQYPVHYEILQEVDTPTSSTPSADELEIMRQQGAIPKRPSVRPLPPPKPTQAGTICTQFLQIIGYIWILGPVHTTKVNPD